MRRIARLLGRIRQNPGYLLYYFRRYAAMMKLLAAFLALLPVRKRICAQNLWLISEKGSEARDNGYHFFRYIRAHRPDIPVYFVITRDSPDLAKIEGIGQALPLNSFRHCLYCLAARVSVNSQPFGALPAPAAELYPLARRLRRKDQTVVYLKHGVIKDELPHILDYAFTRFDLVCCAAERERLFVQKTYGYPDGCVKTLGLCRYDQLLTPHAVKKQLLIMPTFRMWLQAANTEKQASEREKRQFEASAFFSAYARLLRDPSLIGAARKEGYRIVFYPHYGLQPFLRCFEPYESDVVTIADRARYDVQRLLMESALLITDYSSVFFDFAYMGKPEIFYQFDEKQYRDSHYQRGYFDYREDGFGPVFASEAETAAEAVRQMESGCRLQEAYRRRAAGFFRFRDGGCCRRTLEAVSEKARAK